MEPVLPPPVALVAGHDEQPALLSVIDLARRLTGSRRASLMLPDAEDRVLRVAAARGLPPVVPATARVRLGDPVAGLVAQTGRPVLGDGAGSVSPDRAPGYRTAAFISVPVPLPTAARGVLSVADPRRRARFRAEDLAALQQLAEHLARDLALAAARRQLGRAEAEVQRLRAHLVAAQEAERGRIARDLHDEAGQALTAAIFRLDLEALQLSAGAGDARAALERAREALIECAAAQHRIAFGLRPRILEDLGLGAAVRSLMAQAREAGTLGVDLAIEGEERGLGEAVELAGFRVVQEGLTNVRKHSRARWAWVRLGYHADWLMVAVEDDGVGLGAAADTTDERPRLGLSGMRERVALLGGELEIGARPAGGTRLGARLPL